MTSTSKHVKFPHKTANENLAVLFYTFALLGYTTHTLLCFSC